MIISWFGALSICRSLEVRCIPIYESRVCQFLWISVTLKMRLFLDEPYSNIVCTNRLSLCGWHLTDTSAELVSESLKLCRVVWTHPCVLLCHQHRGGVLKKKSLPLVLRGSAGSKFKQHLAIWIATEVGSGAGVRK